MKKVRFVSACRVELAKYTEGVFKADLEGGSSINSFGAVAL
jgi:hypothetical protein